MPPVCGIPGAEFTASSDRYMHILVDRRHGGHASVAIWREAHPGSRSSGRSGREKDGVAMADHQEASVTLPSEPLSVSSARRYVAGVLSEWGLPVDDEAGDTVRLIVSELTTNAVQHTFGQSPTFTVDLRLEREEQLHRCHGQPPALAAATARRRTAGQRQGHDHHPQSHGGVRWPALGDPDGGGRQDGLDRSAVDAPRPDLTTVLADLDVRPGPDVASPAAVGRRWRHQPSRPRARRRPARCGRAVPRQRRAPSPPRPRVRRERSVWSPCPRCSVPCSFSAGRTSSTSGSGRALHRGRCRPRTRARPRRAGGPSVAGSGRALHQGFLTDAVNPKAPVLFLSLLPQFVPDWQPPLPGPPWGSWWTAWVDGCAGRVPPRHRGRQRRGAHRAGAGAGHRSPAALTGGGDPADRQGGAGGRGGGQRTRPYSTLRDQIRSSRTTSPVFGECQILPWPA